MKSHFGVPFDQKEIIREALFSAMIKAYEIYFDTLNVHWNIDCKEFISIHELLEKQYEAHAKSGDALAERMRIMGYKVPCSLKIFGEKVKGRGLSEEGGREEMLSYLVALNEEAFLSLRRVSRLAEKFGDDGLVDLLGGMIRQHELFAWKIRSHLPGE